MVKFLTALIGLVLVAVSTFGQGTGGLHIPAGGGPMPNTYSGTNCRVSGYGMPGGPIEHAYLYILANGVETLVNEFHADFNIYPLAISLAAMFDSSHFTTLTYVQTKIEIFVQNDPEPKTLVSEGVLVYNGLLAMEHPDSLISPDPSEAVYALMDGSNYVLTIQNGGSWTDMEFLQELAGANAVFLTTHGTPTYFLAGNNSHVTPAMIESTREEQIDSGIPPYNTGTIPINFFHAVACNMADTSDFVRICFPYYMAWGGPWMENQGWMGYTCFVATDEAADLATEIWKKLSDGFTGKNAQDDFNKRLEDNPGTFHAWDTIPGEIRDMQSGDLAFYYFPPPPFGGLEDGGCMRLKTVYTGTNDPPMTPWYSPL